MVSLIIFSHILLTHDNFLNSLYSLLLHFCQKSIHVAISTLWYIENFVEDSRQSKKHEKHSSFQKNLHILAKIQEVLFNCRVEDKNQPKSPRQKFYSIKAISIGFGLVAINWGVNGLSRQCRNFILTELYCNPLYLFGEYNLKTFNQNSEKHCLKYHDDTRSRLFNCKIIKFFDIFIYQYFEMQFILNLIDISRRLADIPKEQRNQALKAELNLLNLHLPALICIPTWCEASENCSSHDQLLRIAVSEALILDSAQKCPFFVPIEMLSANNREDNESLDLSYMPLDTSHQKVDQIAIDASEICTIKPIETELLKSAALMILQLSKIKHSDKNVNQEEVNKIYKNIILSIENDNNGDNGNSSGNKSANLSDLVHLENLEQKRDKIKRESPYGSLPNWKLLPLIVKSGSEMRQELFVSQFIALVSEIWEKQDLKLWLYPFKVLATIKGGGLIELIKGAKSLHSIKKNFNITSGFTLRNFFIKV